tara:strand:- start:2644 stop:3135 length:492 start_codon:yes stop_codon:yes gene_type:complete
MRSTKDILKDIEEYKGKKTLKAYRNLKEELAQSKENESLGLGDIVESITKATGIKKVVEVVSEALDIDCGCEGRKQSLNEITLKSLKNIFRKPVVNELSLKDYEWLCGFFENGFPASITGQQQKELHKVYKNVFQIRKEGTNCSPCLKATTKEIYKVYQLHTK